MGKKGAKMELMAGNIFWHFETRPVTETKLLMRSFLKTKSPSFNYSCPHPCGKKYPLSRKRERVWVGGIRGVEFIDGDIRSNILL
jgi:hypothetical protein